MLTGRTIKITFTQYIAYLWRDLFCKSSHFCPLSHNPKARKLGHICFVCKPNQLHSNCQKYPLKHLGTPLDLNEAFLWLTKYCFYYQAAFSLLAEALCMNIKRETYEPLRRLSLQKWQSGTEWFIFSRHAARPFQYREGIGNKAYHR